MGAIIQERGKEFEYYVRALRGQYGDLAALIFDCNREIFTMRLKPTPWFQPIMIDKIKIGKFYLINYNYNGNKLYCPIFVIDYRVTEKTKHVAYALNMDYLPFDYKVLYFNKLHNIAQQIFDFNSDAESVLKETPIPVNFEMIYNTLKNNGDYNYAITAFDMTKIVECFEVSTNLLYLLIHVSMRPVNVALLKENMKNYEEGSEEKEKIDSTIKKLEEFAESYDNDVKSYYERLRNIESNYKLFD